MATRSTSPPASTCSACASRLKRLEAMTGTGRDPPPRSARLTRWAYTAQVPAGTCACTVGTGDSCQPTPDRQRVGAGSGELARRARPSPRTGCRPRRRSAPGHPQQHREARRPRPRGPPAAPRQGSARGAARHRPSASSRRLVSGRGELVDQVALGAHHLHRVEAQLDGPVRAPRRSRRRSRRSVLRHRPGIGAGEPAVHGGRRDRAQRRPCRRAGQRVPPGVEELQGDQPPGVVHRPGGPAQRRPVGGVVEHAVTGAAGTCRAHRGAAGDDQPGAAARPVPRRTRPAPRRRRPGSPGSGAWRP